MYFNCLSYIYLFSNIQHELFFLRKHWPIFSSMIHNLWFFLSKNKILNLTFFHISTSYYRNFRIFSFRYFPVWNFKIKSFTFSYSLGNFCKRNHYALYLFSVAASKHSLPFYLPGIYICRNGEACRNSNIFTIIRYCNYCSA